MAKRKKWPSSAKFEIAALALKGEMPLTVNQGYNLLDEGFYLLSSANPADTKQQVTSFHQ